MEYANASNQVGDDELGIGMATHLFLTENEDDVAGTQLESSLLSFVSFIKKLWPKSSTNFPLRIRLADLKVLDPHNRMEVMPASVIRLCQHLISVHQWI